MTLSADRRAFVEADVLRLLAQRPMTGAELIAAIATDQAAFYEVIKDLQEEQSVTWRQLRLRGKGHGQGRAARVYELVSDDSLARIAAGRR